MKLPVNRFKAALQRREAQIGLWVGLADPYAAELLATTGFDWLLIDGEHAPNDVQSVLAQLQALAAYPVSPVLRIVQGETALIKQVLDIGALTLLVPMVSTAAQAAQIVAATRYAPRGVRGLGSALARASRWSSVDAYAERAESEICVLVQVESVEGLANVAAIAAVEGIDGVFFGPADLSASMGHLGRPQHADVLNAIDGGIAAVLAAGKAAGILVTDKALACRYLAAGALFVAVGLDTSLLGHSARALAAEFGRTPPE
jgi:4-hydroxy-2-oxoheptanedioate aldolase